MLSRVSYTADGVTTVFAVPYSVLEQGATVLVFIDGVEVSTGVTFDDIANQVSIVPAPANGSVVQLRRSTETTQRLVDFEGSSSLTEADLDLSAQQVFDVVQEAVDGLDDTIQLTPAGVFDAQGQRIVNVGASVDPSDAVTRDEVESLSSASLTAAQTAAADAAASAAAASVSEDNAAASAASSAVSSSQASAGAASALSAAGTAGSHASDALVSASNAASFANQADAFNTGAQSASVSAANASSSATAAKNDAETAAANASVSESNAASSAAAAQQAAQDTQDVSAAVTAAEAARDAAQASETAAATSESNAASSAGSAAAANSNATTAASLADVAKTDAEAARDAAQSARDDAESAEADALNHSQTASSAAAASASSAGDASAAEANATTAAANAATSESNAATSESNAAASAAAAAAPPTITVFVRRYSEGTQGGSAAAGDNDVVWNATEPANGLGVAATLQTGGVDFQVTATGTYRILAINAIYRVENHKLQLMDGTTEVANGFTQFTPAAQFDQDMGVFDKILSLTAGTNYHINHYCDSAQATNGFGVAASQGAELYGQLTIQRIA